jgi:IMP cyclohydrolase
VQSAATPVVVLNVNGQPVTVDQRTLTMSERQAVKSVLAKLDYESDDLDALCATIWVVMRRTDPALTFAEVCDAITLESLSEATSEDDSSPEE